VNSLGGEGKVYLGIDPGLATLGFGLIEEKDNRLLCREYGIISTASNEEMPERLLNLYNKTNELIVHYKPSNVAMEQLFFSKNVKTAFQVGQARGVIILAAAQNGLEVFEYSPLEIKKAITGYGQADKKQMQSLVKSILQLKEIPKPDDAADALAVAICHLQVHQLRKKMEESQ